MHNHMNLRGNMNRQILLKWSTCALCVLTVSLNGNGIDAPEPKPVPKPKEEHVGINSRPMDKEEKEEFEQIVKNEQCSKTPSSFKGKPLDCNKSDQLSKKEIKAGCCYSGRPNFYVPEDGYELSYALPSRKQAIMEDGSSWKTKPSDTYKLHDWHPNDFLVITQNRNWWSSRKFPYLIMNQDSNQTVEVYLHDGPVVNDPMHYKIHVIDYHTDELVINNLTQWKVYSRDHSILSKWRKEDTIIIGVNTGWGTSMPNILINVNQLNHVRAKRI